LIRQKVDNKNFKIFIDFDGTITKQDVGEEIFLKFGDSEEAYKIIHRWIDGEITSSEVWILLCNTVENLTVENFNNFIDSFELDDYFSEFVNYCDENGFEITVLSDGLDYYINRIMGNAGFDNLRTYSNKVTIKEGTLLPEFPHGDEECKLCANCKRNSVISHSSDDDITIYIGDGFSDTCPAQYCDYIFAKKSLLKYLEKNRVSYSPFSTLKDVIRGIEKLKDKKRVKKSHQAQLKRRAVYMQG